MPFEITIEKEADIELLNVTQVRKAIAERSEMLAKVFEEAGENMDPTKVKSFEVKDGNDLAIQIRARNDELGKLGKRAETFNELDIAKENTERWKKWAETHQIDPSKFAPKSDDQPPAPKQMKSWGTMFAESPEYKLAVDRKNGNVGLELKISGADFLRQKATFLTSAGWAPETTRTGRVVLDEQRDIEVTDIFPLIPTGQAAIVYMEETTFTNAAAERAENASYVESALALTEKSETVRSIGTSLPVTDEQLADEAGVAAYLDTRLGFMVRQRMDSQLIVGDGNAPNLRGTLNVAGINTQAKGADSILDALYKGGKLVRITGRAIPSAVIIHPNDWEPVVLLKTADGIYIWGNPSEGGPMRVWSWPVIETTAVTENTAIVGDYARFSALHLREGLEILSGFVSNDFLQGRRTIRAGLRAAVVHYRPTAFTQVTGL